MSLVRKLELLATAPKSDLVIYQMARTQSRQYTWLAFADDEDEGTSNLVRHAIHELSLIKGDAEGIQDKINRNLIDLIKMFSSQEHSGFSAGYLTGALEKLMRFEPLTPLMGTPDEWCILDYDDRMYAQNKRCGHVFMRRDGTAYDIDGKVFREPDGCCFTSKDSVVEVKFPYMPETEFIDVPSREVREAGNQATTERSPVTSSTEARAVGRVRYLTIKEVKAAYYRKYGKRNPREVLEEIYRKQKQQALASADCKCLTSITADKCKQKSCPRRNRR